MKVKERLMQWIDSAVDRLDAMPGRWLLLLLAACALFGLLVGVAIAEAEAGEADLSWSPPYTYCDGTQMATPSAFRVLWGRVDTAQALIDGATLEHRVTGLTPGEWWFAVTAIGPSDSAAEPPEESSIVGPVFKTIVAEEFRMLESVVYTVVKRVDRFVLLPVGTAPAGTPCVAEQAVNGHHAVARAAVTWSGLIRPDVVVAKCG